MAAGLTGSELAQAVIGEPADDAIAGSPTRPTIIRDQSAADYNAAPGLRATALKRMARSAAHFRWAQDNPTEPTDAMRLGTMAHVKLWEPSAWDDRYESAPTCGRRSLPDRAAWHDAEMSAWAAGRELVTSEQADQADAIAAAARRHPWVRAMLAAPGDAEASLYWVDRQTDVPCKARPDRMVRRADCIILPDLKTTRDAGPRAFGFAAADLGYDLAAAHYADGVTALTGMPVVFVFIAVESEPPHGVVVYELSAADMAAAGERRQVLLDLYGRCEAAGQWPGYPEPVTTLKLPRRGRQESDE